MGETLGETLGETPGETLGDREEGETELEGLPSAKLTTLGPGTVNPSSLSV